jgi:hypothetical protein
MASFRNPGVHDVDHHPSLSNKFSLVKLGFSKLITPKSNLMWNIEYFQILWRGKEWSYNYSEYCNFDVNRISQFQIYEVLCFSCRTVRNVQVSFVKLCKSSVVSPLFVVSVTLCQVIRIQKWLIAVHTYFRGARGIIVGSALCYKPQGRGFDSRSGHWFCQVT